MYGVNAFVENHLDEKLTLLRDRQFPKIKKKNFAIDVKNVS